MKDPLIGTEIELLLFGGSRHKKREFYVWSKARAMENHLAL